MRCFPLRLAVAASLLAFAAPVAAQSFWLDHDSDHVSLEVLHPTLADGALTPFSFAAFGTAAVRVVESVRLDIELPFGRARWDTEGADASTSVGNARVGVTTIPEGGSGVYWSGGVRIPLAEDPGSAGVAGLLSSASDRYEAFFPNLVAIDASGRYVAAVGDAAFVSTSFGVVTDVPTEGGLDTELFVRYGARGWLEPGDIRVGAGLSGRYLVSEPDIAFADRTVHELGIWGDYAFGGVRTGVRVQVPLGDLADALDRVVGVYVRFQLP